MVSQEDMLNEFKKRQSILHSGYEFVVLELKNKTKSRVSGIETLKCTRDENGKDVYEIVQRQLQFDLDIQRAGQKTATIPITDFNKNFLASHLDGGYWDIIEVMPTIGNFHSFIEELKSIREKNIKEAIDQPVQETKRDDGVFDIADMDEEILLDEIERRKKKKSEVDINMSDKEFNKLSPGKKGIVTKARKKAGWKRKPKKEVEVPVETPVEIEHPVGEAVKSKFVQQVGVGVTPP
jgi:hypothetical protein